MGPASAAAPKSDRGGLVILIGIVACLAVCGAAIYFVKGIIIGGSGFKGILLGTLVGWGAAFLLTALVELPKKSMPSARAKAGLDVGRALVMLGLAVVFVFLFLIPIFRADPTSYYYGAPTAEYRVTYSSGREETRSGAELATEKWEFRAGAYLSASLVFATVTLAGLAQTLRRREN